MGNSKTEWVQARPYVATNPAWIGAGLLVTAMAIWCEIVRTAPLLPTSVDVQLPQVTRALAAGLFLIAGVMRLARWRLTDDPQAARAATALLLLGAALPVVALVGPLIQQPAALAHAAPAARLLLIYPVLGLLAAGGASGSRDIRPLPTAAVLLAAWAVAVTALTNLRSVPALPLMNTPGVWLVAELVAAGAWILLSAATWRRARRDSRPARTWVAVALLLMGVCELLKARSISQGPAVLDPATGLQLIAAAVVATVATIELRDAFRAMGTRSQQVEDNLVDVEHRLAQVEQGQRERLHDARSAVIGVLGAARLLSQPSPLAVLDPQRLHTLMAAELHRLQELLDTDSAEQKGEFGLADVLGPVVLAHRLLGGVVDSKLGTTRATGRPRTTATALANVLANVRSHAPGANVTMHAEQQGAQIVLVVEDDGVGIPTNERERVLLRGVRGSAPGPGSGLGLYNAAAAMRDQSGSLRLDERVGGGTRAVLTLPAAAQPPAAAIESAR